uniref:FBA_2 domain-containing protein n=1 Tax=Caenorhabditis tropicalis TaxID=1561998 RepID=A0A1I7TEV3_9PELO
MQLAFHSNIFKNLMKIIKIRQKSVTWSLFGPSNRFEYLIINNIRLFVEHQIFEKCVPICWKIKNTKWSLRALSPFFQAIYCEEEEPKKTNLLKDLYDDIFSIVTIRSCRLITKNASLTSISSCFLWKCQKSNFDEIEIHQVPEDPFVSFEELRFLLEDLSCDSMRLYLKIGHPRTDFRIRLKGKSIDIHNCGCISFESFCEMECEEVYIERWNTTFEDIIRFVNSWLNGNLKHLKGFTVICFVVREHVFQEFEHLFVQQEVPHFFRKDRSKFIRRQDGKVARLSIEDKCVHFGTEYYS